VGGGDVGWCGARVRGSGGEGGVGERGGRGRGRGEGRLRWDGMGRVRTYNNWSRHRVSIVKSILGQASTSPA
jgi:hypothetical protein